MRLVVLAALTVLLLPLDMPRVHAEEIKYKSRPQPPDDDGRYKKPADRPQPPPSKPPENRPPDRPPDKEHPEKKPPDPQQPPDSQPPTPPPPMHPGLPGNPPRQPRPCPPGAPSDFDIGYPEPDPIVVPLPMDMNSVLVQRIRLMRLEGFAGDVIVGWRTELTFGAAFDAVLRYDIGSMAEAFTAQAVYLLIESNRLALETTLGELFQAAPEDKRSITIGQLLVHASGLGNTNAAGGDTDRDIAVGHLLSQPLLGAPGTTFSHSDDGYVVLAAAIEIASGTTYATYLRQSGVVDAGMTSTIFAGDTSWGTRGSGGILCSARDLYVWASRFAAGVGLIPDKVMRPFAWNDGVGIGHGWFWTPDPDYPIKWASGTSESDDNVIVVVYPSNAILVVASNRYHGDVPWSERVATSLDPLLQSWVPPSTGVQWSANR